jgi:fibrillarin-like pre-rRNA processing protein
MDPLAIRQHSHSGVFTDGTDLYTRSPSGVRPRGDRVVKGDNGHDYRSFPPNGTKLAAIVKRGVTNWPFTSDSRVLYLGAGAGTTVSYMADVCPQGQIYAVEFAPEPFRSLVEVARGRTNVVPILADARTPAAYTTQVGTPVDVVYQDVAQRDQWDIAHRNALVLLAPNGWVFLVLKASSVDVSRPAAEVYADVRTAIKASGLHLEEVIDLDPFDREHAVFVVRRS